MNKSKCIFCIVVEVTAICTYHPGSIPVSVVKIYAARMGDRGERTMTMMDMEYPVYSHSYSLGVRVQASDLNMDQSSAQHKQIDNTHNTARAWFSQQIATWMSIWKCKLVN